LKLNQPRLRLDPLEPSHARLLFNGLRDARLYDFIADEMPQSVEALERRYERLAIRKSPDGSHDWLNWALWSLSEETYVGYVQATVGRTGAAEIAYVLFHDHWGAGYAREAVSAMLATLRDMYGPLEIRARVDPRNHRSGKLLRALGFELVGVRKNAEEIRGEWADEEDYRLTQR
jgi:RimJ/RimL family protein N-acetyltransferase